MQFRLRVPWRPQHADQPHYPLHWPTLPHRRGATYVDHVRPQRWNWEVLARPIDHTVERVAHHPLEHVQVIGLRYFWLTGLFNAVGENFYLSFIPLFALAYGATNGEVGWITAIANLMGAIALFPGARISSQMAQRKPLVVRTLGLGWVMLLGLACVPWLSSAPRAAILLIVGLNGLRAFMTNFATPAWTAMVADLVPEFMRGRYFASRNLVMGAAALAVAPTTGWLIRTGNGWAGSTVTGYQIVFALAFLFGMVSSLNFARIPEPSMVQGGSATAVQNSSLWQAVRSSPGFLGLVASALVWNLALQIAAPFFNIYLVNNLGGNATWVGMLASVSSLFALLGQLYFGRQLERKGAIWVQRVSGFAVVFLPFGWLLVAAPWQVSFINALGGFMWAGYNLANFNLLLALTPNDQRAQAVALYQTVVFGSAFVGPVLGGYLADLFDYRLIFGLSGAGRLLGILLFVWLAAVPALRHGKGLPIEEERNRL